MLAIRSWFCSLCEHLLHWCCSREGFVAGGWRSTWRQDQLWDSGKVTRSLVVISNARCFIMSTQFCWCLYYQKIRFNGKPCALVWANSVIEYWIMTHRFSLRGITITEKHALVRSCRTCKICGVFISNPIIIFDRCLKETTWLKSDWVMYSTFMKIHLAKISSLKSQISY